ncbi:alkaline phosphatase [Marinilabiliaceae bacterium JC017]|nr:alkaline phosphatase [Marinilabiliaceae bacterium JC017]
MKKLLLFGAMFLFIGTTSFAQENYKTVNPKHEFNNNEFHDVRYYSEKELKFKKRPKNVILLIGDGMGVAQVFTGITANKGDLNLINMRSIGFSRTQSADDYVTDSAAGGTALSCGQKTYNGAIGVDVNKQPIQSILEIAEENEKATGLVSTSAITHATPAAFIAHQPKRSMYEEIAGDFMNTDIDVFIGGGRDFFEKRQDERNLLEELKTKGYQVFNSVDEASKVEEGKLAILTAKGHNPGYKDRGEMLPDATEKAIEILDGASKKGFFLMVEGSQIDWGGHQNNASFVGGEMLDFDQAIGKALEYAVNSRNTLVIVTADHETGGMAIEGGDMRKGYVKANFTTGHHSGLMVPVFAFGPGAEEFGGIYENTEIFNKIYKLYRFKKTK